MDLTESFYDDDEMMGIANEPLDVVSGPIILVWTAGVAILVSVLLLLMSDTTVPAVVGYLLAIVVVTALVIMYRARSAKVQAENENFVPSPLADMTGSALLGLGLGFGLLHGWRIAFAITAWLETR